MRILLDLKTFHARIFFFKLFNFILHGFYLMYFIFKKIWFKSYDINYKNESIRPIQGRKVKHTLFYPFIFIYLFLLNQHQSHLFEEKISYNIKTQILLSTKGLWRKKKKINTTFILMINTLHFFLRNALSENTIT